MSSVILSEARLSEAMECESKAGSPEPGFPDCAGFAQSGMAAFPILDCWREKDPRIINSEMLIQVFLRVVKFNII